MKWETCNQRCKWGEHSRACLARRTLLSLRGRDSTLPVGTYAAIAREIGISYDTVATNAHRLGIWVWR